MVLRTHRIGKLFVTHSGMLHVSYRDPWKLWCRNLIYFGNVSTSNMSLTYLTFMYLLIFTYYSIILFKILVLVSSHVLFFFFIYCGPSLKFNPLIYVTSLFLRNSLHENSFLESLYSLPRYTYKLLSTKICSSYCWGFGILFLLEPYRVFVTPSGSPIFSYSFISYIPRLQSFSRSSSLTLPRMSRTIPAK